LTTGHLIDKDNHAEFNLFQNIPGVIHSENPKNGCSFILYTDPNNYDKIVEEYICLKNTSSGSNDSEFEVQKDLIKGIKTFEQIITERNMVSQECNSKEQLNIVLVVSQSYNTDRQVASVSNISTNITQEALSQLNEIKSLKEACKFVDKYGHIYKKRTLCHGPTRPLELLISSIKKSKDELRKIGAEYLSNVRFNDNGIGIAYAPPNPFACECVLYTLNKRLNLNDDYKYLYFNKTLYKEFIYKDTFIWEYYSMTLPEKSLKIKSLVKVKLNSLNLLDQASNLIKKCNSVKENWKMELDSATQKESFNFEYYIKENVFQEVIDFYDNDKEPFERRERLVRPSRLVTRIDRANNYFDVLIQNNKKLVKLYSYSDRFIFLEKSQDVFDYLNSEMKKDKNQEILLIFYNQKQIGGSESSAFGRILWILEHLISRITKAKFVFIDYNLHELNHIKEQQLLLEAPFFDNKFQVPHFELHSAILDELKSKINPDQTLNLSSLNLPGTINCDIPESEKNYCIKRIDLKNNYLVAIDMFNFMSDNIADVSVEELLLNGNFISYIEQITLFFMPSLKILDLSSNFLKSLNGEQFLKNTNLTHLDISNNRLISIEISAFEPLKKLKILNLSSNLLAKIDDMIFKYLNLLEILHLDHNLIEYVSDNAFSANVCLRKLYLNNNIINSFNKYTFQSLKLLELLELSFNLISKLEYEYFLGLNNLKQLCLQNNSVISLERGHFKDLTGLRVLLAQSNKISCIENNALIDLIGLKVLTLYNNELARSFNQKRLRKKLKKLKHFYFSREETTKLKDLLVYEKIKKYLIN
jgi:Leucine-rich repeat (LRR) protein